MTPTAQPAEIVERVVGRGPAGLAAARQRLDELRGVDHPSLCVPTSLELAPSGEVIARSARVPGADLASLMRMRDGLSAGECVTVGTAIGGALAALHAGGLAHGDVSPANVVVSGRGAVLVDVLAGAGADERGTPGFAAPERAVAATPAADVYSLGRVLLGAASEDARERVGAWVAPMVEPRPQDRPSAAECARALADCAPPLPIRLPELGVAASVRAQAREPLDQTRREESSRGWRIRKAVASSVRIAGLGLAGLAVVAVVVVGIVATVGVHGLGGRGGAAWPTPLSEAIFGPPPDAAAASLVQARLNALAAGDPEALVRTTGAVAPARVDDAPIADAVRSGDLRYEGFSGTVGESEVVVAGNGEATVRVVYAVSAHVEAGSAGRGARPSALVVAEVEIRWGPSGWRIERFLPAP
jgi:tRNA A-37 threonylcarbamoyl transferase component Bud32